MSPSLCALRAARPSLTHYPGGIGQSFEIPYSLAFCGGAERTTYLGILLLMHSVVKLKREFLAHLETEGRSAKTLENYDRYLGRFFDFSKIKKPTDITEAQVHAFKQYLSTQSGTKTAGQIAPMKLRTQNYYLIAIRRFLTFLQLRGLKVLAPKSIQLASVEHNPTSQLSHAEVKCLLAAPNQRTLEGLRDRAILELLCDTRLRVAELCALNSPAVDLTTGDLALTDSQKRSRSILLSSATLKTLKKYLRKRADTHEELFVRYGRKMHDGTGARLSPKAVQRMVRKYAIQTGITQLVTPEILRLGPTAMI
jgi:integrase/recombinase XerD